MSKMNETINRYNLRPYRYKVEGNTTFLDTKEGRFVIKEKKENKNQIFSYLSSRNFNYYPKIYSDEKDEVELMEFIEETPMPKEQKMSDLIDLLALLHSKTTHFKEIEEDTYKKLYEDIQNNISYLQSYYEDYLSIFESKAFMSPSDYLFARNSSEVFAALSYASKALKIWYEKVQTKTKQRYAVLHNNLDITHFLRNKNSYFISWGKSKFGSPIFDLYKLYKRSALEYDFNELLKRYEKGYPLLEEERNLFFLLIAIPEKVEFQGTEYQKCKNITRMMDVLFKTEQLISPYDSEKGEQKKQE